MTARDEVLARIRQANAAAGVTAAPAGLPGGAPAYRAQGERDLAGRLDLLADRLADYRATVRRCAPDGLAAEVAAALAERGARRVVVPPGLDPALLAAADAEVTVDGQPEILGPAALDAMDAVVTGAAVAIAETGTIVLDASPAQGRRAITLVPDYHLCIVGADQVVELVPEGVAQLAATANRPLTWISGPSATSDIELERVEGVHGPRTLVVIVVSGTR
ncbi:MAG TPA: LUD domain-containing protein [Streptosporangiaceae bacterium]